MESLCDRYEPHPRIDIWFGPPGPNWVSDDFMERIAERAVAHGTGLQTHLSESLYEKLLRRADLRPSRRSSTSTRWASSVPASRWRTRSGSARRRSPSSPGPGRRSATTRARTSGCGRGLRRSTRWCEAGVTVGLGLDGRGLDDDDDMFREMRVALQLHRGPVIGSPTLEPRARRSSLATSGGARLLGKADRLGRLAPGYAADLVLVDLARMTWPWTAPEVDPRELPRPAGAGRDVRTVFVGGPDRDGGWPPDRASTSRRRAASSPLGWRPRRLPAGIAVGSRPSASTPRLLSGLGGAGARSLHAVQLADVTISRRYSPACVPGAIGRRAGLGTGCRTPRDERGPKVAARTRQDVSRCQPDSPHRCSRDG